MFSKMLFFSIIFGLSTQIAWASSDYSCSPYWTLNPNGYNNCSNLPILSPSNDTRVNLKLLMVDIGFATLEIKPLSKEDAENGYGKVPFSMDHFENDIFIPQNTINNSKGEDDSGDYGTGSRCVSNDKGKTDFIEALNKSTDISAIERILLTDGRQNLNPTCVDVPDSDTSKDIQIKGIQSLTGKQFMQYLTAATAFYEGRYGEAEHHFTSLIDSKQPWLKETSCYMLGRTKLNLSQQNAFDQYGFPDLDKVDQKPLMASEEKFNAYLKNYPSGLYASSARGLLRRIYWLSNQPQKLADEYEWQLNHLKSPQNNLSLNALAQEMDQKLFINADPKQIKNPIFLATLDLSLMRSIDSSDKKQISFSDLQKQQSLFANHKALYEYLLAAHRFYVQKDAANTLKTLSDLIPPKMTYLDFSRLILRGLALESIKDYIGARKLWLKLLSVSKQPLQAETLQLALAINYEHSNELELVFAANSPITESPIRNILICNGASANLLRQIIKSKNNSDQERYIALYTLLYKDLLQGQYQDYIQDYPLLKDASKYTLPLEMDHGDKPQLTLFTWSCQRSKDCYGCSSTLDIAKILAKNAKDPYGLICLSDFVNANDLETIYSAQPSLYSAKPLFNADSTELGSAPSHFSGDIFLRGETYKIIIDDANAASNLKAYALYRAINCYNPTGSNHCGGDDVDQSVRKTWFQTLKTRYAKTIWAKSLKYYW